jgi:ferredoxin
MTIFYFTGTGNSLWAAKQLAESNAAQLISIPAVIDERREYRDDAIGFVYPQYAVGLPKMVRRFIEQNTFAADYLFAVDLYAFFHARALGEIAGLLPIQYGAYLKTPNNFIFAINSPKSSEKNLKAAQTRLNRIIADVSTRKVRHIAPSQKVGNATRYFGVCKFEVTANCTKCGACAKVCPAGNVVVADKVTFGDKCENCFSCANNCPNHAIHSNAAMLKRRQYRNPNVTVEEIAKSNNRTVAK